MSSDHAGKRVLILDQGYLKDRKDKPVHGIELFRAHLIRQMCELGVDVTVAAERSWKKRFPEILRGAEPSFSWTPNLGGVGPNAAWAAVSHAGARFDAVLFGNVGKGILPAMRIARGIGVGRRYVAFAHRRPAPSVVKAVARAHAKDRMKLVCVSEFVAQRFREVMGAAPRVMYGLPNASEFHPPPVPREGAPVRFVLLGRLPNVSKGHERTIRAFDALPPDVQGNCELHLASFIEPTEIPVEGVVPHTWVKSGDVPELLRGMDVMVCASSNETFSQAIVQGMLTGLPIVATPLPVYVEKLDEGGGAVVETDDEMTAAMAAYARDARRRVEEGEAGRATAQDRYVWRTERFLDEVLFA